MNRVVLAGTLLLCACAQTRITAFDREAQTFTVCGNQLARKEDYWKAAIDSCITPRLRGCNETSTVVGVSTYQGLTGPLYAVDRAYGSCCQFHCDGSSSRTDTRTLPSEKPNEPSEETKALVGGMR